MKKPAERAGYCVYWCEIKLLDPHRTGLLRCCRLCKAMENKYDVYDRDKEKQLAPSARVDIMQSACCDCKAWNNGGNAKYPCKRIPYKS